MKLELNTIYNEDCAYGMKKIPDDSIDLVITSPPYDDLRDYNHEIDYATVIKELYRIMKIGGTVVWVVGDKVVRGSKTLSSFKQALLFKENGFNVYDVIIYQKNSMSAPNKKRYFNCFEYMFIFTKKKPKTVNLLSDRKNKCSGATGGISRRRNPDGSFSFNKRRPISEYGVRTNVWSYDVGYNKSAKDPVAFLHPATFPEQLVEDHIYSWSNEGDIILDPFMGSGTTAIGCIKTNRNFIGFELEDKYCDIAHQRISNFKMKMDLL